MISAISGPSLAHHWAISEVGKVVLAFKGRGETPANCGGNFAVTICRGLEGHIGGAQPEPGAEAAAEPLLTKPDHETRSFESGLGSRDPLAHRKRLRL